MSTKIRLAKYIAHAGVCSRKQASRLIDEGAVIVNNRIRMTLLAFITTCLLLRGFTLLAVLIKTPVACLY